MSKTTKIMLILFIPLMLLFSASPANAMHISEGILPFKWAVLWFAASAPFLMWGLRDLRIRSGETPQYKILVGMVGAAVFIISCMPIPVPFAGTCSHPCGTGLAAIIIGPSVTVVITSIALIFQALFLAHGGLSTLGADIFSMGVAGAFAGYGLFKLCLHLKVPFLAAAFMAGIFSDWATYTITSLELSSALHTSGSFAAMFIAILVAFMPTQIPLGVFEGFMCAGAYKFIAVRRPDLLENGKKINALEAAE